MNKANNKIKEYRQDKLSRGLFKNLIINLIIIFIIIFILFNITGISENNKIEDETSTTIHESTTILTLKTKIDNHDIVVSSANVLDNEEVYSNNKVTQDEAYLLAKIAMAEAEGESLETKILVVLTILNRVNSAEFPNTIEGVIYERNKAGVYQFSCIADGRWDKVEPNSECYEAVNRALNLEHDEYDSILYFEACKEESWHSRNLELVRKSDNTRFYK